MSATSRTSRAVAAASCAAPSVGSQSNQNEERRVNAGGMESADEQIVSQSTSCSICHHALRAHSRSSQTAAYPAAKLRPCQCDVRRSHFWVQMICLHSGDEGNGTRKPRLVDTQSHPTPTSAGFPVVTQDDDGREERQPFWQSS